MPDQRYDIAIIGGGPAGATLAALMAGAGWSVAVVERAEFPRRKVCGEFLSATTIPILARLGLANAFLDTTIGAIPVVGDAFDVLFRANMKNMALLRRYLEKKGHRMGATVIDGEAVRVGHVRRHEVGACLLQPE